MSTGMHEVPVKVVLAAFEPEPVWAHETTFNVGCWPPPGYEDDPQGFTQVVANRMYLRYNSYPTELHGDFNERELEDIAAYRAKRNRSLSVGDFLVIGETVLRCDSVGWSIVNSNSIARTQW